MILLEIYGKPVPWQAAKICKNFSYNPKHKEKEATKWQIQAQYKEEPITTPCMVEFQFYMQIPKSASKIKRRQMLAGIMFPMVKPDTTNMQKFYEDCLKGIVIKDDSLVVDIIARKRYSSQPRTVIRIIPLGIDTLPQLTHCLDICPLRTKGEVYAFSEG